MRGRKSLQIQPSRRERQQVDQLLSGGLQPARTVLRALPVRQMDRGQSTPAVAARKQARHKLNYTIKRAQY
jgi:hypothetical protein